MPSPSAGEGARVAEGVGQEAGQAFRLGEDAGEAVNLARTAEQDGGAVDALLSKEATAAQAGKSEVQLAEEGEAAALGKCNDGGGCFASGTEVETGSGEEKPIEQVKVGDSVMSRDQFDPSAPAQPATVTAVYVHTAYDLRDVTVVDAHGSSELIRATGEHPFYVQDTGWVAAAELVPGERLEGPDGSVATVGGNVDEPHPEGVSVYNLQVAADHTYFVSQGGDWVWVHNVYQLHHIATNKSATYTADFKDLFESVGKDLSDPENIVRVNNHVGPHPEIYHEIVWLHLSSAVKGLNGAAREAAFERALEQLAEACETQGHRINYLITRHLPQNFTFPANFHLPPVWAGGVKF